jgi:hypothetical protein
LDADHRDVVGDDIVQLARDPRPSTAGGVLEQITGGGRRTAALISASARARPAIPANAAAGARQARSTLSTPASEPLGTGCASSATQNSDAEPQPKLWMSSREVLDRIDPAASSAAFSLRRHARPAG